MARFEDLTTTKKGAVGEAAVDKYLIGLGIIPYAPHAGIAHPFDRLCASADKKTIFIAECKAKAARTYYPDTGIDKVAYDGYRHILSKYGIDVWLFFVDEFRGTIYGNLLSILEEPRSIQHSGKTTTYPLVQKTKAGKVIIYFPLAAMINVCAISEEDKTALIELSSRSYAYAKAETIE